MLSDIRKLKAALAAPLDFGDVDNDGDNASEVSAAKAPTKVTTVTGQEDQCAHSNEE